MKKHPVRISVLDPDDASVELMGVCVDFDCEDDAVAAFMAAVREITSEKCYQQLVDELRAVAAGKGALQ